MKAAQRNPMHVHSEVPLFQWDFLPVRNLPNKICSFALIHWNHCQILNNALESSPNVCKGDRRDNRPKPSQTGACPDFSLLAFWSQKPAHLVRFRVSSRDREEEVGVGHGRIPYDGNQNMATYSISKHRVAEEGGRVIWGLMRAWWGGCRGSQWVQAQPLSSCAKQKLHLAYLQCCPGRGAGH